MTNSKIINLEITDQDSFIQLQCNSIIAESTIGQVNILLDHANMLINLKRSKLTLITNQEDVSIFIDGGLMSIYNNKIGLVTDSFVNINNKTKKDISNLHYKIANLEEMLNSKKEESDLKIIRNKILFYKDALNYIK
jgi:F0F1-type ATP synthase epsilon subunit